MNKKIFRSSLLTAFLVLASTIALIMGTLYDFFERQMQEELEGRADVIAQAVEKDGVRFFDGFSSSDERVTLIDLDGSVLYDSEAEEGTLDNHAEREEIEEATAYGTGMSIRYSKTLMEKTIYYAVRLEDRKILRVSAKQHTVASILLGLVQPLLCIMAVALALTLFLSSRVSKAIVGPINKLDLETPENNSDAYEELTPLLRKIADQKQTIEENLADAHKKQEEFNLITENMSEGFIVVDEDASLLTYNTAALDLLGITPPADGNVLTYCREKDFRETVAKALSGERAENTMEKGGRSYGLIANPVFEAGKAIGAVVVILDITEREKREALRREFTANVSHELKTPLTSISGFAELMKEGDVAPDTALDFSASIYDEAQRLIALVNDIITISELDGGSVPFEEEEVDVHALAKEILGRLESQAKKKDVTLSLLGGPAKVKGVRRILDEMLGNLCDNAIKYNKEHGAVDVVVSQSEREVSVLVRDTGIGIPDAQKERVFERFYRVDKSHSKQVGGTGLGLAIVKHGALFHHAGIRLESTEGKGTSVTLSFPKG